MDAEGIGQPGMPRGIPIPTSQGNQTPNQRPTNIESRRIMPQTKRYEYQIPLLIKGWINRYEITHQTGVVTESYPQLSEMKIGLQETGEDDFREYPSILWIPEEKEAIENGIRVEERETIWLGQVMHNSHFPRENENYEKPNCEDVHIRYWDIKITDDGEIASHHLNVVYQGEEYFLDGSYNYEMLRRMYTFASRPDLP